MAVEVIAREPKVGREVVDQRVVERGGAPEAVNHDDIGAGTVGLDEQVPTAGVG